MRGGHLATGTVEPPTNDDIDESLPTDTSETPPSYWSRTFGPNEPSFGMPEEELEAEQPTPSRVRDYQPSLAERVQRAAQRRKGVNTAQRSSMRWAERSALRRQASAQASQRVAAAAVRLLGKAGGRLAGAALGNVVGAAIAIALTIKDIASVVTHQLQGSRIITGVLAGFIFLLLLGIITLFAFISNRGQRGPSLAGGVTPDYIDDQQLAGVASGEYSIVSAKSVADLQRVRTRLSTLLQQNTNLSSNDRTKAAGLINQMSEIEKKIKTSAYASEESAMASNVKAYQRLISDFYAILYPSGATARQQAVAMLNSGVIGTTNICRGMSDDDIRGWSLSPRLLEVIVEMGKFAAANGFQLEINCIARGHRPGTFHELGQAVDIQWRGDQTTGKLLVFLSENRERFQLAELIFNDAAQGHGPGFYNFNNRSPQLNGRVYAGDHKGHIHLAVRQ